MPQATNLVLKNGASVDKTFTLLSPAAGYGSAAEWALKEGAIPAVFPRVTAVMRNGNGPTGRAPTKVLQLKMRTPSSYVDGNSTKTLLGSSAELNVTVSFPEDYPETAKADAVAFFSGILGTALIKSMITDGAPAS